MNRQEKIKLLNAIKAGVLRAEDLTLEHGIVFISDNEESYERNGKVFTKQEYEAYIEALRLKDERRKAAGLPEHNVITVIYRRDPRNEPIKE